MTSDRWAPISKGVAILLWGEPNPRLSKGDKLRWGIRGSKSLDADKGIWKDFENGPGGGVLALVETERQTDRAGAIQWLKDNGFLSESPHRRTERRFNGRSGRITSQYRAMANRNRTPPKPEPKENGKARWLWVESRPIGAFDSQHPFWRWVTTGDKPGVLHPWCTVPGGIRWSRYSGGVILGGVFPLNAWENAREKGDRDGIPQGDPVAVQALAIDQDGNNRYVLGQDNDLRRCSYGSMTDGVFILGDSTGKRVNVVEGIADALAVYSRVPGAVLATLGTSTTLAKKPDVINWLTTKETWVYPDNDANKAGDKGAAVLIDCIKGKSSDAVVARVNARAFEDPGQWAEKTPFADFERYDFDEKSGMLFDSGLAWGEADRVAVHILTGRIES